MKLKEYRKKRNMSKEQLAEKSGVAKASICKYEQERRTPLVSNAVYIAEALGVKDMRGFRELWDI